MKLVAIFLLAITAPALAQGGLANLKVVTDASPDYSDMESMTRSITLNHKTDADKMWALFYWDHLARRSTWGPVRLRNVDVTDPIRLFNDYGVTHPITMAGVKCSEWNYMGYPCRFYGSISDVWYDRRYHAYDNQYSNFFFLQDGKTVASVEDLALSLAGPETDNKPVPGYLILYRAAHANSPNGYLQGADGDRSLKQMAEFYVPAKGSQYTGYNQDRGHRYIVNLRPGEIFTRFYSRQDVRTPRATAWDPNGMPWYKSDPAYFAVTNRDGAGRPFDPEMIVWTCRVRGNGERIFNPPLDESHLPQVLHSSSNVKSRLAALSPVNSNNPAVAVFKVEGANVITSIRLRALFSLATPDDSASIAISTTNGLEWKDVWKSEKAGDVTAELRLVDEVNGSYDALVKVTLNAKRSAPPENALLKSISFNTLTQLNTKALPQLNIGSNTVCVGVGEQTDSIVLWPDLNDRKHPAIAEEKNVRQRPVDWGGGRLAPEKVEPAYIVFKVDAPTDITGFTYGGRFANRAAKSRAEIAHSFDNGKTWHTDGTLTEKSEDIIRYESVHHAPAGNRSVLLKYTLVPEVGNEDVNIYSVRMEVNHRLGGGAKEPLEVTFNYGERQTDFSLIPRSHTQLVDKFPTTYKIDVGGADHPVLESLTVAYKGSRPDITYGYSGREAAPPVAPAATTATAPSTAPATLPAPPAPAPQKWIAKWATYGNNLALKKKYTLSAPSGDWWGSGDPKFDKLTDGHLTSTFSGAQRFPMAAAWSPNTNPEITVDLGELKKCAAFRIQTVGYEPWDAAKGECQDKIELLTSSDGRTFVSQGFFKTNLHRKDIPVNFMIPDDESLGAYNLTLAPAAAIEARYVKYKATSVRVFGVTEVQVLDSYSLLPWDLNISLPDPAQNGKPAPKADISPNAKKFADADKPPPKK